MFHLATCYLSGYQTDTQNIIDREQYIQAANPCYKTIKIAELDCLTYLDSSDHSFRFSDYSYLENKLLSHGIPFSKAWLSSGYFMWKPFFIYKTLQEIPLGEILHYHDFSIAKYPTYLSNLGMNPAHMATALKNHSILLFKELGKQVRHDVKESLMHQYALKPQSFGLWAGSIFLRHDEAAIQFLQSWCDYTNPENTLPFPTATHAALGNTPCIAFHSADQAVLTSIVMANPSIIDSSYRIRLIFNRNISRPPILALIIFLYYMLLNKIRQFKHYLVFRLLIT